MLGETSSSIADESQAAVASASADTDQWGAIPIGDWAFARFPGRSIAAAIGIAVATFVATQLLQLGLVARGSGLLADSTLWQREGTILWGVLSLLIGFALAARYRERIGACEDLNALLPVLTAAPGAVEAWRCRLRCLDPKPAVLSGFLVAVGGLVVVLLSGPNEAMHAHDAYIYSVLVVTIGWIFGTTISHRSQQDTVFRELTAHLVAIDPLSPETHYPLVRRGFRRGTECLVGAALLVPVVTVLRTPWPSLTVLLPLWTLAFAFAAIPVLDVRRQIRAAKASVLRTLRNHLRARLSGETDMHAGAGALSDLVALQTFVKALPEWPLEVGVVLPFVANLALSIVSSVVTSKLKDMLAGVPS